MLALSRESGPCKEYVTAHICKSHVTIFRGGAERWGFTDSVGRGVSVLKIVSCTARKERNDAFAGHPHYYQYFVFPGRAPNHHA